MSPIIDTNLKYSILQLYLGSNPLSKLEVVSSLNSFNLAHAMYFYSYIDRPAKFNPKVYLGTVQTTSIQWNDDSQTGQNNSLQNIVPGGQKSGSIIKNINPHLQRGDKF